MAVPSSSLAPLHFLRSSTKTVPSLAEAPTLSPRLFQHTWSKDSTDYRELAGTDLKDAPRALVGVDQLAALSVPDVDTPGEGAVRTSWQ